MFTSRLTQLSCVLVVLIFALDCPSSGEEPKTTAKPDAFPTLVNPNCSHCVDEAKRRAEELTEADPVLAWTRGYSDGGAIPIRFFLNQYRVISDSYGVFVHDPEAGYARGFAPSYKFVFHGWRNGIMTMKDTTDGTLYSCLSGVAFEGPRKGERLVTIPTLTTTWGDVMKRSPHAVAYHMFEKYKPIELPKKDHEDSIATRGKVDPRLGAETLVLGVRIGDQALAIPIEKLQAVTELSFAGEKLVILKSPTAVAAYKPTASQPRKFLAPRPDKNGVSPPNPGKPLPNGKELPPITVSDFKNWDVAGRCKEGEYAGWTLQPVDAVRCKWFAWAAEYPKTEIHQAKAEPKPTAKMISGTSEFLRLLPKPFGVIKALDTKANTVTLLLDGEKLAKVWNIEPDAELYINGYWGRLEQFKPDQRVWVWLRLNRAKQPTSVAMIMDELSEYHLHASLAKQPTGKYTAEDISKRQTEQREWLRQRWERDGLPGTLTFHHVFSGELEVMLDHEAIRWGRALKEGDSVMLGTAPEIKGVVKMISPWRERTLVRVVVRELESADLNSGQRIHMKVPALTKEQETSSYPPDIDRNRSREARAEWFLCSIYCVCAVGKDTCTGMFYTLASCNPNGCGAPELTRQEILELIDKKKTDREIWDLLLKDRGSLMLRPHLRP